MYVIQIPLIDYTTLLLIVDLLTYFPEKLSLAPRGLSSSSMTPILGPEYLKSFEVVCRMEACNAHLDH